MRGFAAAAKHDDHHHQTPGKASGRMSGNPGWYNKRFTRSTGAEFS